MVCVSVCLCSFKGPYCNRELQLFAANMVLAGRALFEILSAVKNVRADT